MKPKSSSRGRALRYALTNHANRGFYGTFVFAVMVSAMFIATDNVALGLAILGTCTVGIVAVFLSSVVQYNTVDAHNKHALLENWARAASDPADSDARWALLETCSLDDAMARAGLHYSGPRYNIDGTPMMPGHSTIDLNGHAYGAHELAASQLDQDTHIWSDPANAYTSPLSDSGSFSDPFGSGSS